MTFMRIEYFCQAFCVCMCKRFSILVGPHVLRRIRISAFFFASHWDKYELISMNFLLINAIMCMLIKGPNTHCTCLFVCDVYVW